MNTFRKGDFAQIASDRLTYSKTVGGTWHFRKKEVSLRGAIVEVLGRYKKSKKLKIEILDVITGGFRFQDAEDSELVEPTKTIKQIFSIPKPFSYGGFTRSLHVEFIIQIRSCWVVETVKTLKYLKGEHSTTNYKTSIPKVTHGIYDTYEDALLAAIESKERVIKNTEESLVTAKGQLKEAIEELKGRME